MAALTDKGFHRPLLSEIIEQQETRAKVLFGDNIDTDEKTPLGKFIRLGAQDLEDAYGNLEGVYNSIFPNTARGSSLDRVAATAGIFRNPATDAEHEVEFIGNPGYIIPAGFVVSGNSIEFHTEEATNLSPEGKGTNNVFANEAGASGNVPAGSISEIVNPDENVESVTHTAVLQEGQDEETDPELRARYHLALRGAGSTTADAIRAAVLRAGARSCTAFENTGQTEDAAGRPPGSFECIVFAPDSENDALARAIFRSKPVGIRAFGSTEVQIKDDSGNVQTIAFTHATNLAVFAKVLVLTDDTFPADGADKIKNAMCTAVGELENGDDVVLTRLYGPISAITGVRDIPSLQLSVDGKTFSATNIICTPTQAAVLPVENVTVEVGAYVDK